MVLRLVFHFKYKLCAAPNTYPALFPRKLSYLLYKRNVRKRGKRKAAIGS